MHSRAGPETDCSGYRRSGHYDWPLSPLRKGHLLWYLVPSLQLSFQVYRIDLL